MDIRFKKDYAIVSTDIMHVNSREMRQMYELKNSIKDVLDSHKPDSKEKKYISDDDWHIKHHFNIYRNVDRVYDLTVVHPGVKRNCTH